MDIQMTPEEHAANKRDGWLIAVAAFAAVCMVAAVMAAGYASRSRSTSTSSGETRTIEVVLTEFAVSPARIEVAPGTRVRVKAVNKGAMPHDLKWQGRTGTPMIDPGGSAEADLGVISATGQAWCTVPGHKDAGMVLDIVVGGASSAAAPAGATTASTAAKIDPNATPAASWKPYDPSLKPATGGTEHKITLRATETVLEVAPGVTQEMWTFDDKVPGTTLRGKVGDVFTITLVNDGKIGHSVDFHASKVAWNVEMRTIKPGESLSYQFEAKFAGAFMYHCGTAPALHHIGNGMFGVIIIDPPDLAPVAHEYLLVQSELYLGAPGRPGDLTKMVDEQWDAVVFNGYWSQYKFSPIRVETNERVRVWVVDDGPSENSAFHIVGTVFDTVYKEGTYLLKPDQRRGGSQVLDLQPAQGGFVEFTFDKVGLYPIVTHKFSNVGKGALGLFQAGEVATAGAGAGH
jgi:nitrite reductase (NO-forming)